MAKTKYYVVWVGRQTGVFETWEECSAQVSGYPKAVYKSFKTRELAEQAFKSSSAEFIGKDFFESELTPEQLALLGSPVRESISVDGAWDTTTGVAEYQGIHTETGKILFKGGPFEDGTNNIVELIDRAVKWLNKNTYDNEILKWETKAWGENPADFGRK